MPNISVVVPVYNAEEYLERCLQSILSQTLKDFELILVDDGSPDDCGLICDKYAEIDNRISVYHYPNQGVSAARNHGIEVSKGKWIAFIDSDDYVLPNYLQGLYQSAQRSNADLIMTGIKHVFENDLQQDIVREWSEITVKKENLDLLYKNNILQFQKGPVIKLFKNEVIRANSLRFNEQLSRGEDALFVYEYLLHVNVISVSSGSDYVYCRRGGSLLSQRLASFKKELYAYECMKSIILQLLRQVEIKHPYPKQYLVYWFDRVINSLYKGEEKYNFRQRYKCLKSLDYKYYEAWKMPVSNNDMILKKLLCRKHVVLADMIEMLIS